MQIYDLPDAEMCDMMAYDQLNAETCDMMKANPSLVGLAASMEAERPTVLAVAIYDNILDCDGKPGIMDLVKWNDEIYEFCQWGHAPYKPWLKTSDISVQSVWACIAQFTDRSRKAGARTLMVRASLPKPTSGGDHE